MHSTHLDLPDDGYDGSTNSVIVIVIADRTKIIRGEPPLGISFLFLLGAFLMMLRLNVFCIPVFVIVSGCHIPIESGHVLHSLCQNMSKQYWNKHPVTIVLQLRIDFHHLERTHIRFRYPTGSLLT